MDEQSAESVIEDVNEYLDTASQETYEHHEQQETEEVVYETETSSLILEPDSIDFVVTD